MEVDVIFDGRSKTIGPVSVLVPQGENEITFVLVVQNTNQPAVFHHPFIVWESDSTPSGIVGPIPSQDFLRLTLTDFNSNLGPDPVLMPFGFLVGFDGEVLELDSPDPAIINEPPIP